MNVALAVALAALAQTPDRDQEIFGASPAASEPVQTTTTATAASRAADDREASIFGGEAPEAATPAPAEKGEVFEEGLAPAPGEGILNERLSDSSDWLAIGGLAYLWLQYNLVDRDYPETHALSSPSFADVYLDARPNDRVRAYLRGRLRYNPSAIEGELVSFGQPAEPLRAELDQFWMKFDIARTLFVTAGKEKVKWGTGRFWNPTDFLNQDTLDPLAGVTIFDQRLGVTLLKLHLPIESLGWNFYAVGTFDGASAPEEIGAALRAEILFGETELSLAFGGRKNNPLRLGATISSGLGPVDVRGEIAVQHKNSRNFVRGTCSPNQALANIETDPLSFVRPQGFSLPAELGETYSREEDWIPQAVAGVELPVGYGDDDSVYFGAEYFFNDAGYDDRNLYPCLIAQGAFTPFYLGRHYAAAYMLLPGPGRWDDTTFVLSFIGNLSDSSAVGRFDYRVRVLTYLDIGAFVNAHFGAAGSEFRFAVETRPLNRERLLNSIAPAPSPNDPIGRLNRRDAEDTLDRALEDPRVGALTNGFFVPAPELELGATLSLSF